MADKPLQSQQDSIILPVYDAPSIRTSNTSAGLYFEQSYVNCYPEVYRNLTQYALPQLDAIKRAGTLANTALVPTIASYGTSDDMVCLANTVVTQLYDIYIAAFFDSNTNKIYIIQYRPIALTTTKIGEITGANINDVVFITEIVDTGSLTPGIAISYQKSDKSSGTGYYSISLAGVFSGAATPQGLNVIASASFPSNLATPRIITGPFQHMNGHTYIMTIDGFIYESQLTATNPDITAWNTNATVTASQYPDRGVGVYRYKHLLIAAGQDSMEFWSPDNNAPPQSSLVRTDQAFIKFGAASPKLVININDVLYWVSYSSSDTIGVWQLEGYAPSKISTQREDTLLMNFSNATGYPPYFSLEAILLNSKTHLVFNGPISYSLLFTGGGNIGSGDTFQLNSGDGRCVIQVFSIVDKIWWSMNMLNNSNCYIHPVTAYPSTLTAGQYAQYFFRRTSTATGNDQVTSTRPFSWVVNGAEGTWYDDNPSASTTTQAITVAITWNTLWNVTTKRKFLRKIIALIDTLTKGGADGNIYSLYFLYNKSGNYASSTDTIARPILVPGINTTNTSQRYYVNNCGAYRQLNLGIALKSKDFFRMEGLELEVAGGTS